LNIDSDTQLRAIVPAGATSGKIRVIHPDSTVESSDDFTVIDPPSIVGFSPATGVVGTEVTISGSELANVTEVAFNGIPAEIFTVDSDNTLRANVPVGANTGPIVLTNLAGSDTSASDFVVLQVPVILSFSPTNGPVGTEVTVTGSDFTGVTDVLFNGLSATSLNIDSDTELRAVVPAGASSGKIRVIHPDSTVESAGDFTVIDPPSIASFSPASGVTGTEVTISGSNLADVTDVFFNGTRADILVVDSDSEVQAQVPSGASTGTISLSNASGSDTSSSDFIVLQVPGIASFSPTSGSVGTEVTITGSEFTGVTDVLFNGLSASSLNIDSDTQLRAVVPTGASSGKLQVVHPDGTVESSADFTVILPPSIISFTPTSGQTGTEVIIIGSDLDDIDAVLFNGVPAASFVIDSNTQLRAQVPNNASTGVIEVSNAAGNALTTQDFQVTSEQGTLVVNPIGDARVRSNEPNKNYESDLLKIREAGALHYSFLKFDLTGLSGSVISAKLRLLVLDGGPDGGTIYLVSNNYQGSNEAWEEFGITWNKAPEIDADPLDSVGSVDAGDVIEFDVSDVVTGSGIFSFGLKNISSDAVDYSSKEGDFPPELVIEKLTSLPEILSFAPTEGAVGTEVTILGDNLSATTLVSIGGMPAAFSIDSDGRVTAEVPAGASSGKILVANSDGNAQSEDDFVVLLPPVIASFTPTAGTVGEQVTVFGSGFDSVTDVALDATAASFTAISDGELRFPVPAGATSGVLSMTSLGGTITSPSTFQVIDIASISSFSPSNGVAGDEVTIVGANFNGTTAVSFNGTTASVFEVDSDTQLRAEVPDGATTGTLSVTNAAGTGTSGDAFTVIDPPSLAGFSPASGVVGTEVTISGSELANVTEVAFNGILAEIFTVDSDNTLRANVPVGASTGPIVLTNLAGSDTSASDFVVLQVPVILSFSPTNGPVGTEVTVTGSEFTGVTDVLFNGLSTSSLNIDSDTELLPVARSASSIRIARLKAPTTLPLSILPALPASVPQPVLSVRR
jgi:predicted amino acid-binding ACT domain protein